jgi:hypothetical protein
LAAEAMGYKTNKKANKPDSLSGCALTILASLYQYGLVTRKIGEMGISEDAFTILNAPEDSQDKADALAKCGSKPKVFREIYTKYSNNLPADNILIWYLQQQKYSKQAAETIIQCYKETVEYANLHEKWPSADTEENPDIPQNTGIPPNGGQKTFPQGTGTPSLKPIVLAFPFGEKTASIAIAGGKPSKEEMGLLIKMLEAYKETLPN